MNCLQLLLAGKKAGGGGGGRGKQQLGKGMYGEAGSSFVLVGLRETRKVLSPLLSYCCAHLAGVENLPVYV